MTVSKLSSLLCCSSSDAEAWLQIRPDETATAEGDDAIKQAFRDVHDLIRQRNERRRLATIERNKKAPALAEPAPPSGFLR